jgi:hypothetical protein
VFAASPSTLSAPAAGGSLTVAVTTGSGCAWTATSGASWITITSGAAGTGNGTVGLTAAANGQAARTASLTVAGQAVTVSQDGTPPPTYGLSGRITDPFIGPSLGIPGVSVTLSGGPSPGSATTDFSGNYTIPGLLAGTYTVTFAKASYVTATGTATISGTFSTSLSMPLSLDVPAQPSTSNLTGYWTGTGTYPNAPFKLALIQAGTQFRGMYADGHDVSPSVSGTYATPEFTLRVDFGDAVLFLECLLEEAREVSGVQRTSALGNRPYPFDMKR